MTPPLTCQRVSAVRSYQLDKTLEIYSRCFSARKTRVCILCTCRWWLREN